VRASLRSAFLLAFAGLAGSGSDASLQSLYDGHRWFELREAIQGAETYLSRSVERASSAGEADEGHGVLAYLYARLGRSRDAVRQFDEMLKLKPARYGLNLSASSEAEAHVLGLEVQQVHFSNEFAALVKERGSRTSKRVTQIGGSKDRDVIGLPELRLRIGGLEAALRPANVFAKPVGNEFQHGLLGWTSSVRRAR
jgi:hypothetical protein